MTEPIFKEADLELCEVPVPQGYPQSQTHAGELFFAKEFISLHLLSPRFVLEG